MNKLIPDHLYKKEEVDRAFDMGIDVEELIANDGNNEIIRDLWEIR